MKVSSHRSFLASFFMATSMALGEAERLTSWVSREGFDVVFYACCHCKYLLMGYGRGGWYFDILGELTDEFIAVLIASKLGRELKSSKGTY
jgi:hypothetical protein